MNTHQKNNIDLYKCFMQVGQVAFSKDPSLIYSVCGNGVLIVLRDRIQRVGGVAHCIYPRASWFKPENNFYVDTAIYSLFRSLKPYNAVAQNMEAQLLGGGSRQGLNKKRAEKVLKRARGVLRKLNVNIVSEDVGGSLEEKLFLIRNPVS